MISFASIINSLGGANLMKKIILFAVCLSVTAAAFADGCSTSGYQHGDNYFGKTECQKAELSQLKVQGQLDMSQVDVNGDTAVNGNVGGHDLSVKGAFTVNGKTTLNKVKVTGLTTINGQTTLSDANLQGLTVKGKLDVSGSRLGNTTVAGNVNLRDVVMRGTLTATSDLVVLNGVEVKGIKITKLLPDKSQTICLEKASHVQGDIHFDSGNGTVYVIGASKIIGKVTGGKVVEGACPSQGEVTVQ